jgi:DHA2 family multidrug resistance protein
VLFATLALLPPYLSTLMNYPVLTIGLVLAPRGVGTMFSMMVVGRLLGRIDARWPILVGMGLMVFSLHGMTQFGPNASMHAIIWLGVVQGMGLGLVFVPISTVAYATLEPHQRTEAAGLFSLVRNIGSSVGISVVMTMLSRAMQVNHAEIGARIPAFGAETTLLPAAMNPSTATGLALLNAEVNRQAAAIGYLNDFKLMMLLTLVSMPLVLLMRGGKAPSGGNAGADAAAAH